MASALAIDELVGTLHNDPLVQSRVGDRVLQQGHAANVLLPHIMISSASALKETMNPNNGVTVITCRARTPAEADKVGAAVIQVISDPRSRSNVSGWVKIQDRSGYDAMTKAFKRVIALRPRD